MSANWCVALGEDASGNVDVEHWNGVRWEPEQIQSPQGNAFDVSCAAASACVAVGGKGGTEPRPLAWIWNGQHWTDRSPPNPSSAAIIH